MPLSKLIIARMRGMAQNREKQIRTLALDNAIRFNGRANLGSVIGKLISESPEVKKDMKALALDVQKVIDEVNSLSHDEQRETLEQLGPDLPDRKLDRKKEKKERNIFGFLKIDRKAKVRTAFPPEPSKYPHIGHAKALLLNEQLAKTYRGSFVLRFEDTNPTLAKKEFYSIHIDNYKWLGVTWDRTEYASDHMKAFSAYAEMLITKGKAYVCTCSQEHIRMRRMKKTACRCRSNTAEENLSLWRLMAKMDEGQAVLRLRADMQSNNTAMRDPALMRVIKAPHARLGTKFRVWPTYDFENACMDGMQAITHRLRSKEFELRNEVQRFIQAELGLPETTIYEFARFNLEGVESSGRIIREMIARKQLIGWDDPSLTTLVALRRRGFQPGAIKNFVLGSGITKSEARLTWDDLIVQNRRVLDASARRYFFIGDRVRITVQDCAKKKAKLKLHPGSKKRERAFSLDGKFIIEKEDYERFENGRLYRLMDCCNIRKEEGRIVFDSEDVDVFRKSGTGIVHWLPLNDNLVDVEILMPDKTVKKGKAEKSARKIRQGEVVQFERFGFCRLDRKEKAKDSRKDKLFFWYTHR